MAKENEPVGLPEEGLPLYPLELPPSLAAFLRESEYACVMQESDQGTLFIMKAPTPDIQSLRGNIPIRLHHQLYDHPLAPVIRTVIRFYDRPANPLLVETFTNIDDPQQRSEFAHLA